MARRKRTNHIARLTNAYGKIIKTTMNTAVKGLFAVTACLIVGMLVLGTEANYSTARAKEKASKIEVILKGAQQVYQVVKAVK